MINFTVDTLLYWLIVIIYGASHKVAGGSVWTFLMPLSCFFLHILGAQSYAANSNFKNSVKVLQHCDVLFHVWHCLLFLADLNLHFLDLIIRVAIHTHHSMLVTQFLCIYENCHSLEVHLFPNYLITSRGRAEIICHFSVY